MTTKLPFHDLWDSPTTLRTVISLYTPATFRPPRPQLISDELWEFIEACWDTDHLKRPTMQTTISRLRELEVMHAAP